MTQGLEDRNTATVVSETAIFSVVMILSLVGNLLVCFAVYRNPRLRCPSNYYIISLAMSDILQALCTMPLSVAFLASSRWPFGTSLCYISAVSKLSLAKISLYTMALMALNRYYKIVKASKYQATFKKKFIIVTTSMAWVTPIFVWLLAAFAFGFNAEPKPQFGVCILDFHQLVGFAMPSLIVFFYLPYFIIAFCYWNIYRVVNTHNSSVSWQSSNIHDIKVSKTLFVTVIGFASLWMPAHVILITSIQVTLPRELTLLGTLLVFSSSCVNPFIYGFMNRAFKHEFKKCLMLKRMHRVSP